MDVSEVVTFFKTQTAAADALSIKQHTIAGWKQRGAVPPLRQIQLEALTRGKLKADPSCYGPARRR